MQKFEIPIGNDRLSIPISMVKGVKSNKVLKIQKLSEVFKRITSDDTKFKDFSQNLKQLKVSAPAEYSKLKQTSCEGFIIGDFEKRTDKDCKCYVPLIGFDIDSLGDAPLDIFLSDIRKSPYVFAAFPSPSFQGFRIFIWCDATPQTHKTTYEQVCSHLSDILNIPTNKQLRAKKRKIKGNPHIDSGTNNISRIWFFSHVEKSLFYLNIDSKVFVPKEPLKEVKTNKRPPNTPTPLPSRPNGNVIVSVEQRINISLSNAKRKNNPAERNNFIYGFASELCKHGIAQSMAMGECLKFQEKDFDEAEIKTAVISAYKKNKLGHFSDKQILKFLNNGTNGKAEAPKLTKKAPVKKPKEDLAPPEPKEEGKKKNKFQQIKSYIFRKYEFRRNIISIEIEYKLKGSKHPFKELNDNDLVIELMEIGWSSVESIIVAIMKSSLVFDYDPIKFYFDNLPKWDESKPDYIKQLAGYIEAKDQHWFNTQFKKMLVRSAACALKIIPFNKQCFTLVGKQNDGKTSFLRFLCPAPLQDYFKENLDIQNKDGRLALCTNFFINLDELANFSKYEVTKTKAFFTIDKVKERLPYDRKASSFARRASFVASTNSKEFLTDETGNVRWLVYEIKNIKHDNGGPNGYGKNVDINNVWAQVFYLLKSGFNFKLTPTELKKSEQNNKSHQVVSIEQEFIEERYFPATKSEYDTQKTVNDRGELIEEINKKIQFKTTKDFYREISTDLPKLRTSVQSIGRALKFLGFEKSQKFFREHNQQRKGYYTKNFIFSNKN